MGWEPLALSLGPGTGHPLPYCGEQGAVAARLEMACRIVPMAKRFLGLNHIRNTVQKLETSTRIELAALAKAVGLFPQHAPGRVLRI